MPVWMKNSTKLHSLINKASLDAVGQGLSLPSIRAAWNFISNSFLVIPGGYFWVSWEKMKVVVS
jgi:hypothetical protein